MPVSPPFPWYGSKRRWAPLLWERFGDDLGAYVEPFAGSLACLLHRVTPAPREVVCDTDGALCNFWRAISAEPEVVAEHCDYPTIHQDLTARHRYLIQWTIDNADRLSEDPEYYDARAAGWWVWGLSLWIGPGWCSPPQSRTDLRPHIQKSTSSGRGINAQTEGRPHMHNMSATGSGVSAQRQSIPPDKRPLSPDTSGKGVSQQRQFDKRPRVPDKCGGRGTSAQSARGKMPVVQTKPGTRGVSAPAVKRDQMPRTGDQLSGSHVTAQSTQMPRTDAWPGGAGVAATRKTRPDLIDWFDRIAARMKGVIVLNRSWESAVTPTVLMQTPSGPRKPVGILMDPPYITDDRTKHIYGSDYLGESNRLARESYEWALEHGGRYRIAYCCHEGDFDVPEGWTFETNTFGGIKDAERFKERRDMIMFSPACLPDRQQRLW